MRDPIIDQLAVLERDADRVILADPADLRRVGTRRNRTRLAAAALVVLAVIGGTALAVRPDAQAPPVPAVSPSPTQAAPPEREPCDLQLSDCYPPAVGYLDERLPAPCATMEHPSAASAVEWSTGRGESTRYVPTPGSMAYGMTRVTYRPGGASAYLAEIRSAVARCPSVQRATSLTDPTPVTLRYQEVSRADSPGADETVLLSRTYRTTQGEQTFLISVQRRGDRIRVVMDYGWEGRASTLSDLDLVRSPVIHPWD